MKGFDNEILEFMLERYKQDNPDADMGKAKEIFNMAITYDLAYMNEAGIIKDGEYTDKFYDDDDAFDFVIEHIANAIEIEPYLLAQLVESYFELHDAFMEENGIVEWL